MPYNRYKRKFRRARRGWGAGRRAIKLMDPADRRRLFGPTYMQRLADPSLSEQTPQQRWMRRAMNYRGEGDYWSDIQGWGRKLIPTGSFAKAGKFMGGVLGGHFGLGEEGAGIGQAAGGQLSKWVGFGDYGQPVANQLMGGASGVQNDRITVNASDDLTGDIYLSHSEYVGAVEATAASVDGDTTPTPFNSKIYNLNPGLAASFPFLSQIAQNYEMYELMGCAWQYRPLYGEGAGTSNLLGKVVMATQYDPTAPAFFSSQQMQNYDYASSCKPSIGMIHGVETANKQQFGNMQYIRTGPTPKNLIFTDIGFTQISTEGIIPPSGTPDSANFPIGELWVTYRVKLSRAKLTQLITSQTETFFGVNTLLEAWDVTTAERGINNSGNFKMENVASQIARIRTVPNFSGTYKIFVTSSVPSSADPQPTSFSFGASSATLLNFLHNGSTVTSFRTERVAGSSGTWMTNTAYVTFNPTAAGSAVTLTWNAGPTSVGVKWRVELTPINDASVVNLTSIEDAT